MTRSEEPQVDEMRMIGYWDKPDLPHDIEMIRQSWLNFGPSNITIYNHTTARAFIAEHYGPRELSCFDACAIPAMQSDLFRVLEIYSQGGFYLDLSIQLLQYPALFLEPKNELRLYRRWHGRIVNNAFSAPAGNSLLEKIKDQIINNIEERKSNDVWSITGPKVWNDVTDTGHLSKGIIVHEHDILGGKIVRFRQDLAHKKDGEHWSDKQKTVDIFLDERPKSTRI